MDRASRIFCVLALTASLGLAVVGFDLAALPREAIDARRVGVAPERLGEVELGGGFGRVAVIDMMGHYIENPPAAPASGAAAPAVKRFGGC